MNFTDWERAYKYHKEVNNVKTSYLYALEIKSKMNLHRTSFNWDHLNKLTKTIYVIRQQEGRSNL
jgi:hypothetical protein